MKLLSLFFLFLVSVRAGTLVAPSGLENVEGNSSAIGLFGGGSASRSQIIYSGQLFSSSPPEGVYITGVRFRMDGQYADTFTATPDLEIHLSTTSQNPNGLSATWTENIGSDETVVLPRATVSISSGQANLGGPNSFSIEIPFPTKFRYSPLGGNLLMDATVYSAAGTRNLDWNLGNTDGVSAAVGSISSSTASVVSQTGLITQFVFIPVPEPSSYILTCVGIAWLIRRRKKCHFLML
jgi:hypothetical protein